MELRNELTYTGQEVQDILDNSLLKKSQFLTDAEKQQVRNNLDIKETDLSGYATREEMNESIKEAVDAIPTPDVSSQINEHNSDKNAHLHIQHLVSAVEYKIPTKVSQLENDREYLTEHQDLSHLATKEEMSEVEDKVSMSLEIAESAQEIAINAKNQSSEALRQAQVSIDAISTLKGLENSDEAMAIIAQEITKIAQNSSDIAALKSLIQVMSRKEYDAIEEKDKNVIYMIY